MDTLKLKYPLPCDGTIDFNEAEHSYKIDGNKCISVTQLISTKLEPPAPWDRMKQSTLQTIYKRAEFWKKSYILFQVEHREEAMKTLKHASFTDVLWPMRYEKYYSQETWRLWEFHLESGTTPLESELDKFPPPFSQPTIQFITDSWNRTSDEGKILHAEIERFANYLACDQLDQCPQPPYSAAYLNFLRFFYSHPTLEIIRTEVIMGLKSYNICGTCDALLRCSETGKIYLVDWKNTLSTTSTNPADDDDANCKKTFLPPFHRLKATKRNKYMLQENFYTFILQELGIPIDELLLVNCYHQLPFPVVISFPNITSNSEFKTFINNLNKL